MRKELLRIGARVINPKLQAIQTGKSGTLRLEVPPLRVREPFDDTPITDLCACFDAITMLPELAQFWNMRNLHIKQ